MIVLVWLRSPLCPQGGVSSDPPSGFVYVFSYCPPCDIAGLTNLTGIQIGIDSPSGKIQANLTPELVKGVVHEGNLIGGPSNTPMAEECYWEKNPKCFMAGEIPWSSKVRKFRVNRM